MNKKQSHVHLISSGRYVPKHTLTNNDLMHIVDTSDEWITSRTGIKNRFIAKDEQVVDMAAKAAQKAIEKAKISKNDIDLVIVASITGDMMTPSIANLVCGALDLEHPHVMSFDLNAACTGFNYALETAHALLETKRFKYALVIGAEKLSKIVNYKDRNTCVLFGDGAGAVLLSYDQSCENIKSHFYNASKPDLNDTLTVKEVIQMDGKKVYQFAVDAMQKSLDIILKDAEKQISEIDIIIPHQANDRIISAVAKNMKIDPSKFYVNIANYGNTSAASIPICLDEYLESHPNKDLTVAMVGFGGGFTWGSSLISVKGDVNK